MAVPFLQSGEFSFRQTGEFSHDFKPIWECGGKQYVFRNSCFKPHFKGIFNGARVKVTRAGHISRAVSSHEGRQTIRNLEDGMYATLGYSQDFAMSDKFRLEQDVEYGEKIESYFTDHLAEYPWLKPGQYVKEIKPRNVCATSRLSNLRCLKATFRNARDFINANFSPEDFAKKNSLWVTLTYSSENARTDNSRIWMDFCAFRKRLARRFGSFEYFHAVEPHGDESEGRECWHGFHLHCLLKFPGPAPFISKSDLEKIWRLGFADIKLCDSNNLGAYLSAYVSNVQVSGGCQGAELKSNGKFYLKGGRLAHCPPGMRLFRWSRKLRRPAVCVDRMSDKLRAGLGRCTFSFARQIEVVTSAGKFPVFHGFEVFDDRHGDDEAFSCEDAPEYFSDTC